MSAAATSSGTARFPTGTFLTKLLPTPDVVRWRYAGGRLTFSVVHVPDAMGRLVHRARLAEDPR